MKKTDNIVTGKMIREDTRIVFQKISEAKSSWSDILGTLTSKDAVDYAVKSYSDYSKKAVADANKTAAPSQPAKTDTPKAEPSKPAELPKIDVAGQNKSAAKPSAATGAGMSFKQAFAKARKEAHGGKGQFEYKGTKYQTNIQGTGTSKKPQEKFISAGKQKVTSVKVGNNVAKTPEAPKAPETPKAPEAPKDVTAKVSAQSSTDKFKSMGVLGDTDGSIANASTKPFKKGVGADAAKDNMSGQAMSPTPAKFEKPEDAPINEPKQQSYSPDSPAGKAWANRGTYGTQKEGTISESVVQVGVNKYRIV